MATLVVVDEPFVPVDARSARRVPAGVPLRDLVQPELARKPGHRMTVTVNGDYVLPSMGERVVREGDIVVVTDEVLGGDGNNGVSQAALAAIAFIASFYVGPQAAAALRAFAAAEAVSAVASTLVPTAAPQEKQALAGSTTYSFALDGNELGQQNEPIAVGYGFNRSFPKFAAQPYIQYDNDTSDQYYYAILEVGQGTYDIPRIEIADTNISHFDGVTYNILGPGTAPSLVAANVITSAEVVGQELLTGVVNGAFAACGPGLRVKTLQVDVVFNGLGKQNGSGIDSLSPQIKVYYREIDDYGVALTGNTLIIDETITGATTSDVRRTFSYTFDTAKRIEVFAVRFDVKDESLGALNNMLWAGMRCILDEPAPLCSTATYIELKIKASEQLGGLSQRRVAIFSQRMLRTWSPDTGWSTGLSETRSIAWALADMLSNTAYGGGLPDSRIDLETLYELDQVWAARQDRFDFVFDSAYTFDQAKDLIARAGRAVCMPRGGVYTVMRDQQQTLPVAMYTPRNMVADNGGSSFGMTFSLVNDQTPDAVIVEYFNNAVWDWRHILCPAPGVAAGDVRNPVTERIYGVCGSKHAEREGRYMIADTYYRRCTAQWLSASDGRLPAYGALVLVAHDLPEWGQFGDVVDWDAGSLTLSLSEPVDWSESGQYYVRLQRPDGTAHPAIMCEQGPANDQAFLTAAPDFTPIFDVATKERTKYAIGTSSNGAIECRIKSLVPRGLRQVQITAVQEDDRVHTVDNDLLPAPGEIQDPISGNYSDTPDTGPIFPNLTNRSFYVDTANVDPYVTINFNNNGTLSFTDNNGSTDTITYTDNETVPGQWQLLPSISSTRAADFELVLHLVSGVAITSPGMDTPLNLGTTQTLGLGPLGDGDPEYVASEGSIFNVQIRDVATHTVQASAQFTIVLNRRNNHT
jgi:hypothetical protein